MFFNKKPLRPKSPKTQANLKVGLLIVLAHALLPVLTILVYMYLGQKELALRNSQASLIKVAQVSSLVYNFQFNKAYHFLLVLSQSPAIANQDVKSCQQLLTSILSNDPEKSFLNIGVADLEGNIFCTGAPLEKPENIRERLYFKSALETNDFSLGELQTDRVTNEPTIIASYPVKNQEQKATSVVYVSISLSWLDKLASQTQLPPNSSLTLLDKNGVILSHYPDPEKWIGVNIADSELVKHILSGKSEDVFRIKEIDRVDRIYAFTSLQKQLGSRKIYLAIGIPQNIIYKEVHDYHQKNLLMLLLVIAIPIMIVMTDWYFFFAKRYTRQISG